MDVNEVVKEVLELFCSIMPDHKCVIHIIELTRGLAGCLLSAACS
jgi:hypothetical protein